MCVCVCVCLYVGVCVAACLSVCSIMKIMQINGSPSIPATAQMLLHVPQLEELSLAVFLVLNIKVLLLRFAPFRV